jgi:hypothetical protein
MHSRYPDSWQDQARRCEPYAYTYLNMVIEVARSQNQCVKSGQTIGIKILLLLLSFFYTSLHCKCINKDPEQQPPPPKVPRLDNITLTYRFCRWVVYLIVYGCTRNFYTPVFRWDALWYCDVCTVCPSVRPSFHPSLQGFLLLNALSFNISSWNLFVAHMWESLGLGKIPLH